MYITEDGEEYFGRIGSDFTQWDPPDELSEDDVELLRVTMAELDEEEAERTSTVVQIEEEDTADSQDDNLSSSKTASGSEIPNGDCSKDDIGASGSDSGDAFDSSRSSVASLRSTSSIRSVKRAHSKSTLSRRKMMSSNNSDHLEESLLKLSGEVKRHSSLHKVPLGRPPASTSNVRKGTGRIIADSRHSIEPKARIHREIRGMLKVLDDGKIRHVLKSLGDEEGAEHLKTREDLVDAIIDKNPTQAMMKNLLEAVIELKLQVASSVQKSSVGAGLLGVPSTKTWSAEAIAAANALSSVAREILSGTTGVGEEQLNLRSCIPEFVSETVDVPKDKFVLKILFPPRDVHSKSSRSSPEPKGKEDTSKDKSNSATADHEAEYLRDKKGWLKKRGHTTHMLTSDYKNRWFELDAQKKELTYYEKEIPDEVLGDGEQNNEVKALREKYRKSNIDLSVVHEIRPSKAKKAPKMAFDLETESRTWIIIPSESDQKSWLGALCNIIYLAEEGSVASEYLQYVDPGLREKFSGVSSGNATHIRKAEAKTASNTATEVSYIAVACDPASSTVKSVLKDAFANFRRRFGKELDEKGPDACALKVTGLREYMATQDQLMAAYTHIQEALKVSGQVELQLVPSHVLDLLIQNAREAESSMPPNNSLDQKSSDPSSGHRDSESRHQTSTLRTTSDNMDEQEWIKKRRKSSLMGRRGNWEKFIDPASGDSFWYNSETEQSQWDEPEEWSETGRSSSDFLSNTLAAHCHAEDGAHLDEAFSFMGSEHLNAKLYTKEQISLPINVFGECLSQRDAVSEPVKESRENSTDMVISKRGARWPLRVRIDCLEGLICQEIKHINKEDKIFDIPDIVNVMVRLQVMVGGEPVLGGRMQTAPVVFKKSMRFVHGFSEHTSRWLTTKLAISSLPSRSRLFIEVLGERDGEGICDIVLASTSLQLCDHTGRMISGPRAVNLWSSVDVNPMYVAHTCPTPWSTIEEVFNTHKISVADVKAIANEVGGKNMSLDNSYSDTATAKNSQSQPLLHLTFDAFEAPIMWNPSTLSEIENKMKGRKSVASLPTGTPRGRYSSSDGYLTKALVAINSYNEGLVQNNSSRLYESFNNMNLYGIDDVDNEDDLDIEKSGWLEFEKKKSTFGRAKWRGPFWFVLQEVTGKLSWYDSKRSDAKLLGQHDLAGVNVEFCPAKNRTYKQGKGSTLKDVETCCFSVQIHSLKPPHTAKISLYLAHKSRREARAWMDAIAKVGLIQSEMTLEEETNSFSPIFEAVSRRSSRERSLSTSTDSTTSVRKISATKRTRMSAGVKGRRKGRVSVFSSGSESHQLPIESDSVKDQMSIERGTGMEDMDLYHLATGRSLWFEHLEMGMQNANPIQALQTRNHGADQQVIQDSNLTKGETQRGSLEMPPHLPLGVLLIDPILAVRFGRRLSDLQRGLMLLWATCKMLYTSERLGQPYASARDHLLRFHGMPSGSASKEQYVQMESDEPPAPSVKGQETISSPPTPGVIYVPAYIAADIKQALGSADIATSPALKRVYRISEDALSDNLHEFALEITEHWNSHSQADNNKQEEAICDAWFFWQRSRYLAWWLAPSSGNMNSNHNKVVNLMTMATSLRQHARERVRKASADVSDSDKTSLCGRFTLAETCEYLAETMFQLDTESTAAVDFLHYEVGDKNDGSFILPSGSDFDFEGTMANLSVRYALSTVPEEPATSVNDALLMLDPLWFDCLRSERSLCDELWNEFLSEAFEVDVKEESLNLPKDLRQGLHQSDEKTISSDRGDQNVSSSYKASRPDAHESVGNMPSSPQRRKLSDHRRRRGSTRDPLVFLKDEEAVSRVVNADPLHELSANEKALLWRHRKRLAERYKFKALPKLLRAVNWFSRHERKSMLELLRDWPRPPGDAATSILELLDEAFHEPDVREFATKGLNALSDNELASCLPQLVQAIKYEPYHSSSLARFLIRRALLSPLQIGLPFFWCCKVELRGHNCRERYGILIACYLRYCGSVQRALIDQQAHLWSETGSFAAVAAAVYACKGQGKKKYVTVLHHHLTMLQQHLPSEFSLPLDPRIICRGIKVEKCRVMSSAKLPLWLVFENADPLGEDIMVMFKAGDDLRQDTMVLQLIRNMDAMWYV